MSRARAALASLAAALFAAFTASADPVTTNDVVDAVAGWINLGESLGGGFAAQPESVRTYTANGGSANYHVVSFAGGGYVVTSGDTALKPVLAYSNTGTWIDDEAKNPLMAMLNIDVAAAMAAEQSSASASATTQKSGLRLSASAAGTTASTQQQDAKAAEWAKLIAAKSSSSSTKGGRRLAAAAPTTDLRVAPLMTTAWNQSYVGSSKKCYNYYTPCNYVCGCTATAMAQVMKYHRYPTGKVTAAHDYFSNVIYSDGGSVVTNGWNLSDGYYASATASSKTKWEPAFGGPYDWDAMVDSPDGSESEAARQAIGLLCRDAAISVFSTFSSGGTAGHGASIASALLDTFGFAGATTTYYNENTLLASLDANLPALFWIANSKYAHEVVADGYGYDSTSTIYVHFNMGWGSVGSDTWYTPPSSIDDYTSVTRMVTGIFTPAQGAPGSSVISGRVLDTDGDPISGATVTVTTDDGTVVATTNSNDKGIYAFILPAGTYNFTATVDSNKGVNRCAVLASTQVTYPTDGYGEGVSNSRSGVNLVVGPDRFVEYVEAADGQYFDTGVIGKPGTKFQTRFMLAPKAAYSKSLIGSYGNSADFWMKFDLDACLNNKFGTAYKYQWLAADVVYEASCECTADNKVVLVIDDADGVNKVNWNLTSTLSDTDKSMYYFARNDNGTANGLCPGRCYGLTIWQVPDGGTDYVLVRNFIPCVRDGRPGLYDAVSREMFYSLAGGDFTPGPAVDTVVLEEDADWTADGAKSYDVPTVIDLNGYTLTVSSLTASSYGVNVVNRSDTPATLVGGIDTDKVVVGGNMTVKLAELTHRWSFNGTSDTENLVDSVGRVTATKLGSKIAYKDGEAVCSGYGSGTGSFNLGENLLDTERATIEIWATLRVASSWARIFDYGPSSSGGYLTLTWSYGKDLAYPKAIVNYSGDKYNQNAFSSAFVTGRRYHISCTVKANGDGSATVRWMRRNAETGVLDGSGSCTQADWTLAKMVNPKLLLGKSQWGDMDAVASYDEVRVWKGILSDEQLAANAVTSPDTVLEPVVAGFAVGAGGIVRVGEPAASVFPGTLDLSSGAKVVFDTASFGGASASFTAYGFTLPAGAANVLDCVELTDAAHYVATLNGSTISVAANASFDAIPVTAEWKGGTPTAESLALASSWTCLNAAGDAITAVPGPETTVIIPVGDTTFTIPSGYTPNWGAIQFGGASATRWARRNYNEARSDIAGVWTDSSAWKDMPLADYSTDSGTLEAFGDFDGSKISRSQVRLDGWFYVSPEQRGVWRFTSTNFDDYLALLVDGEDVVVVNTFSDTNTAGERRLAAGWHRFTLVVGDTSGGASSAINKNALAVSVNGAAAVAFSSLTFGTETGTVKLQADCDLSALGDIALSSGTEVDLNGHTLNLKSVSSDYLGMKFTNSSATSSTLYTESGKVGTGVLTENITVRAPDGFVEYVEAADGQYFDTGVVGKPGTKFLTRFMLAPKAEYNKSLIGSYGNSAQFWMKFDLNACLNNRFGSTGGYSWLAADVVYEASCDCTTGNKVVLVVDDGDGVNKVNWNLTSTMSDTGKNMYYFARNNNGTADGLCPGRCYGLTIWQIPDGGTDYVLVRNFIPCVRDGRPGLYDAVSHEMFYSLAGGDFTPGPAVTPVELTHRWSFTSDYSDSVGTADAVVAGGSGVSVSDGRAVLVGGNNAGYLDLGTGVLGNGDATLEMWFEKLSNPGAWTYAFSYGLNADNFFKLATAFGYNNQSGGDTGSSWAPVYVKVGATDYGTTGWRQYGPALASLLPNLPQHLSVTFKKNSDGSTTVRWMSRDAVTGFLLKEYSTQIPSWTLADSSEFRLWLGRETGGTWTLNSQFDEVRVWNGVLTDEQLSANVLAGPDAAFGDGIVAGFDGMVVAPGETFEVNGTTGGYGYWTDKCVTLRTGAKIRFNTADYFGTGLRFRAGGFVLPVGETDLLSFVELDDTENYTVSLEDANTILVQLKDAIPHTSTWTGSATPSAADLSNAANWTSVNAKGATVTAAPTAKTTAVIPAETLATFTLPGGVSANWGRVLLGGYTRTQWGRIASTGGDNNWITFRDRPVSDYTADGEKDVSYLNRTSGDLPAELGGSQLRFDGWINVSAAQAGRWDIRCKMDDMIAFAVDGEWQFMHNTWRYDITAGCYVSEGWHRFTLIVRDTSGGYGVSTSLNGTLYPFVLSVNGGAEIGFSDLTFGTGATTVALSGDANWAGLGPVFMESGLTVDLNGNSLTVSALDGDFVSTVFTNTSETASTLYTYTGAVGTGVIADNLTVSKLPVATAEWTNAAGDNDASNPANWTCKDSSGNVLGGALPTSDTTTTVNKLPAATLSGASDAFASSSLKVGDASRGEFLQENGTVALGSGHISTAAAGSGLYAMSNGTLTASAEFEVGGYGVGEFVQNGGTTTLNNWLNIGRYGGTGIVTVNGGSLVNTFNNDVYVGCEGGTGTINVGGDGYVEVCNLRLGAGWGSNNKGYVNISGNGHLKTRNWAALCNYNGYSGMYGEVNQSGGTFEVGTDMSVGEHSSGVGVYNMAGGNLTARVLRIGWNSGANGTFNMGGGDVSLSGDLIVGVLSGATGAFVMGDGTFETAWWIHIGNSGTGSFVQNGGTVTLNGASGTDGNWLCLSDAAGGNGTYTINDGTLEVGTGANGGGIFAGRRGTGVFTMNGGTVITPTITADDSGMSTVVLNGGTIKVAKNGGEDSSKHASGIGIIKNIDSLVFGNGTTIDTDGHNTSITGCGYDTVPGSSFVKAGAGTLTAALPSVNDVRVEAGTLKLSANSSASSRAAVNAASGNEYPASPSAALLANNYLLHRWNFNGHLLDLVGTNHAVAVARASLVTDVAQVQTPGGARGTGWIDCGANIIPAELGNTPFTIEFWTTPKSSVDWAQWFAFGSSADANGTGGLQTGIILAPKSGAGNYPSFRVIGAGADSGNVAVGNSNLTADGTKEYHVAAVVKPTGNNAATITLYIEDPSGGETIRISPKNLANWSTSSIVQKNFWLGHSHWNDQDVNSSYNEVRVWAAALSQEQIVANGTLGPDVLPVLSETSTLGFSESISVASGAALDLNGKTVSHPVIAGAGTVQNGTLTVTEKIRVNAGEKLTFTGVTLDLTDTTVEVADTDNLSTAFVFAESGTEITGKPASGVKGWKVKKSADGKTLTLAKVKGMMIIAK